MEDAWKYSLKRRDHRKIKCFPLLISWGTWLAQNASIFNDRPSLLEIIVRQALSILSHFPQEKSCPTNQILYDGFFRQCISK
jgi:hypothetical protein